MIKFKTELELPSAGLSGFEPPLTEDESAIQAAAHRFAKDVLRPIGTELDKLSAEEAIAPGSPYWTVFAEAANLGLGPEFFAQFETATAIKLESIVGEELGWGDAGLAISLQAASFPKILAYAMGSAELVEMCAGKIGCWLITQPDRGSDVQVLYKQDWPAGTPANKGNLTARADGDEFVLNGQCSAWVSNGAVAQIAACYIAADYGQGFTGKDGIVNGLAAVVPLDLKGVSKGKPLEKLGQRALPQGEIYFDNVRIPRRFAAATEGAYAGNMASAWSHAGTVMSQVFVGTARAAFEHALAYAHERRQGGARLIDHQLTRWRLGDMLRRIEMMRAIARRSLEYARTSPRTHPYVTAQAKVTVTDEAMKVATEALQLFGGNGLTREYPLEKILRDVRAAQIEDGENYMLTMRLGLLAGLLYEEGWTQN